MSRDLTPDPSLHVLDLYARLAANRAVDARFALGRCENGAELMAQSAQALEDAAGTLSMLSELYADRRDAFARAISEQASALVALAARFEEAADLARTEPGHH
jgi:Cdc6-like AAA superfamily ATPase